MNKQQKSNQFKTIVNYKDIKYMISINSNPNAKLGLKIKNKQKIKIKNEIKNSN